jgi:tRNA/rRNA methyltransferase
MSETTVLQEARVVLVETSHSGNLGSAARAMKTMGLKHMVLVRPKALINDEARALATSAVDVLENAVIVASVDEALSGCAFSLAATARPREHSPTVFDARSGMQEAVRRATDGPSALVFGNETYGLSNEDAQRCQGIVHIPTSGEMSSLNLAQAVQVLCYEMRMAAGGGAIASPAGGIDRAARIDEVEGLVQHAADVMAKVGFFDPDEPKRLLPRLRRLASRAQMEREEVNILRGLLGAVAKKI